VWPDRPFRPGFEFHDDRDLGLALGLPPIKDKQSLQVRNSLLIALWIFWHSKAWLTYSRDRNVYVVWRRYFGKAFSYLRIMRAIDELDRAKLIIHQRMKPNSSNVFRSRMRFADDVAPRYLEIDIDDIRQLSSQSVRLKDQTKQLIRYTENDYTREIRKDITAQNEILASIDINFGQVAEVSKNRIGLFEFRDGVANPKLRLLYRSFNIDWLHGGRWYGGWWQNLSSEIRSLLLIDGQPVVEHDFSTLHPKLLMASVGRTLRCDPYIVDGLARNLSKQAFQIALNARTRTQAIRTIAIQLRAANSEGPQHKASELLDLLERRNPDFEGFFGTGVGVRLQRVDADLCAAVQRVLRQRGVPALSVHDSFISYVSAAPVVLEVMNDELEKTIKQLRFFGLGA
jgi:hypothetical protein